MRTFFCLLVFCVAVRAGEWGRTLRAAKSDDRHRRAAALKVLAEGQILPHTAGEAAAGERVLARFFSDRFTGAERALAVRAYVRLDRPGIYKKLLKRLEKERDDRVLHGAELAFAGAPKGIVRRLVQHIDKAKEPLERAVFVRMLGAMTDPEARRRIRLRAGIADHWCPWSAAIHALPGQRKTKNPELFKPLMALLDHNDPALLSAATDALARLTGRKYGRDAARWKQWWSEEGQADPFAPPAAPAPPKKAPKHDARSYAKTEERRTIGSTFFGIPITKRKVAFVFDVSGSMRYKLPLAYDQLLRAVKALPPGATFEVVFFNEHVWPWRDRLSHADPVTKELLVRHLPTIEIKSYTNLFDSIARALRLDVEEVFVISDGAPNRGRWRLPRDIIREVKKLNAGKATINTISVVRVVDGDKHIALLRQIAKDGGGRHEQRTLK